jgi:hypothetical protein
MRVKSLSLGGKEMFVIHSTIATTDWDKILAHSRYLTQTRHKICRPQICHNYFRPCLMRCGGVKLIGTLLHKMNQCITISKRTTCHQTGLGFSFHQGVAFHQIWTQLDMFVTVSSLFCKPWQQEIESSQFTKEFLDNVKGGNSLLQHL